MINITALFLHYTMFFIMLTNKIILVNSMGGIQPSSQEVVNQLQQQQHNNNNNNQYIHERDDHHSTKFSAAALSAILNGQLPIDEIDAYKFLQRLKSSEDYHQSSTSTSTTSSQAPPAPLSLSTSSVPWTQNGYNHRNDDNLRPSKILPPIYIQPIFIPYPFVMNPLQYLTDYSSQLIPAIQAETLSSMPSSSLYNNEYEESMSRSNTRHSSSAYRNSPIYYVRMPPTPITFIPTIGYTSPSRNFGTNFNNPFMHFNPQMPTINNYSPPTLSSIFNLPLNFVSNGKPNGIYHLDSGVQNSMNGMNTNNMNQLLSYQQPQQQMNPFTTTSPFYRPTLIRSPTMNGGDSKITNLKRQYFFNGRPDDIYLMQNNYDQSMYSTYQPPLTDYY